MIVLDIDVTKLDKNRFREGRNGQKYCDLVLIDYPKEKSDGFVKQGVSKEEREARVDMPILGNWRHVGKKPEAKRANLPPHWPAPRPQDPDLDTKKETLPF